MEKVTKFSGTVALGTAALASIPSEAPAMPFFDADATMANDTFAMPQMIENMAVDDTISGALDLRNGDLFDFFHITGLPPGGTAAFAVEATNFFGPNLGHMKAEVYSDAATVGSSFNINTNPTRFAVTVRGTADLVLAMTRQSTEIGFENYRITLERVSPAQVPEPATLALAAAGLAGLAGLHVARRRRHG